MYNCVLDSASLLRLDPDAWASMSILFRRGLIQARLNILDLQPLNDFSCLWRAHPSAGLVIY